MKTKKIVAKRFKISKTGKILHRVQGKRHLRRNKSKSRQRRQDTMHQVTTKKFVQVVKQHIQGR